MHDYENIWDQDMVMAKIHQDLKGIFAWKQLHEVLNINWRWYCLYIPSCKYTWEQKVHLTAYSFNLDRILIL